MQSLQFHSQQGEDLFIYRNFINNKINDGVFIELGACDGLKYSNTMFFEQFLNFKGILIEPIYDFYKKLVNNRKRNICINKAINNKSEIEMLVNGAVSGNIDTMSCEFKKRWHKRSKKQLIQTTTLEDLFLENNIKYIDLFSLDVEGENWMY